jgi:hypothetical protein
MAMMGHGTSGDHAPTRAAASDGRPSFVTIARATMAGVGAGAGLEAGFGASVEGAGAGAGVGAAASPGLLVGPKTAPSLTGATTEAGSLSGRLDVVAGGAGVAATVGPAGSLPPPPPQAASTRADAIKAG